MKPIRTEFWALSDEAKEAIKALKSVGISDDDLALEVLEKLWPEHVIYSLDDANADRQ